MVKTLSYRKSQISPPEILTPLMSLPVPATFYLRYVPPSNEKSDDLEADNEAGFKIEREESDADETCMKHTTSHAFSH